MNQFGEVVRNPSPIIIFIVGLVLLLKKNARYLEKNMVVGWSGDWQVRKEKNKRVKIGKKNR